MWSSNSTTFSCFPVTIVGVQNHLVIDESTGAATFADTLSAGATTVQDGTISLTVGADDATTTLTNSTRKRGRIATPHYLTAEEPVGIAIMDAQAAANELSIGGGSGSVNAATKIKFYTAATYNTTTGTEALTIDSSQNVGIGITSPTYALHVARSGAGASSMVESFHATPGSYNESSFRLESKSASSATYDYGFIAIGSTANITRESVNHITLSGGQTVFNEDSL